MNVKGVLIGILGELEDLVQSLPGIKLLLTPEHQRAITPKSALLDDDVCVIHGIRTVIIL